MAADQTKDSLGVAMALMSALQRQANILHLVNTPAYNTDCRASFQCAEGAKGR